MRKKLSMLLVAAIAVIAINCTVLADPITPWSPEMPEIVILPPVDLAE